MGPRKNPDDMWTLVDRSHIRNRRTTKRPFPLRVLNCWFGIVWNLNHPIQRSSMIPKWCNEDSIRAWAHKHALSLIFLSVMFVVTWVVIVIANWSFAS